MKLIEAKSISELASKACDSCKDSVCNNLILHGNFNYDEVDSSIIKAHESIAEEWQSRLKPEHLHINHGEFIHKYGDGYEFIAQELIKKRDSNRAVISLINMETIIDSGDDPIPSFMLLQFGSSNEDFTKLFVTAYFRALEVSRFLPINLAEIAIFIKKLKIKLPIIEKLILIIHAFKAYSKPHFDCLAKSDLDTTECNIIAKAVCDKDTTKIREWISSKQTRVSSVIYTEGLSNLSKAFQAWPENFKSEIQKNIQKVIEYMTLLKEARNSSSHSKLIDDLEKKIDSHLEKAIEILDEESNGA